MSSRPVFGASGLIKYYAAAFLIMIVTCITVTIVNPEGGGLSGEYIRNNALLIGVLSIFVAVLFRVSVMLYDRLNEYGHDQAATRADDVKSESTLPD